MRWNFIICLLLVSAVLTKPRPKRSLGFIKRLFSDKLFGTNKIVIAKPILTSNETYQLFEIPGYNNIIIKVSRNTAQPHNEKPDALIVAPEVAIIGSYLGTTTEKETLLAIEMVKNLINSGVLTGARGFVQELVVPLIPQPPQLPYYEVQNIPLNVYEGGSIYVPTGMQQVKTTPVKTKYSYIQKSPDADTTYASYNGQDVIITRTKKEPYIPQYIKLRIAEVATIGANTYAVRSSIPTNVNPTPYYVNPGPMKPEYLQNTYFAHRIPQSINAVPTYVENISNGGSIRQPIVLNGNPIQYHANPKPMPQHVQNPASYFTHRPPQPLSNGGAEYVANNGYGSPIIVDGNPIVLPQPIHTSSPDRVANNMQLRCKGMNTIGVCPGNIQLKASNNRNVVSITDNPKQTTVNDNDDANAYSIAVNEFLKNYSVNGQLMSQYLYKQMNHHSNENYTIVNVGQAPQLNDIGRNNNVRQHFVYIPPKDVNLPALPSVDKIGKVKGDKNEFVSETPVEANRKPYVSSIKSNGQSNARGFEKPVVVFEPINAENRGLAKNNQAVENKDLYDENNRRGDIPGDF